MTAPWLDDGDVQLYHGDALGVLRSLPAGVAQTCVTSPPYWGLRDYGTGSWTGGAADCDHVPPMGAAAGLASSTLGGGKKTTAHQQTGYGADCGGKRGGADEEGAARQGLRARERIERRGHGLRASG